MIEAVATRGARWKGDRPALPGNRGARSGRWQGHRGIAVVETLERQSTEHPYRVHTREDQVSYVLEGAVVFHLDGMFLPCNPGPCVFLPRGCEHTVTVEADDARLLVMGVPGAGGLLWGAGR